jgi:hypothetical protein
MNKERIIKKASNVNINENIKEDQEQNKNNRLGKMSHRREEIGGGGGGEGLGSWLYIQWLGY